MSYSNLHVDDCSPLILQGAQQDTTQSYSVFSVQTEYVDPLTVVVISTTDNNGTIHM